MPDMMVERATRLPVPLIVNRWSNASGMKSPSVDAESPSEADPTPEPVLSIIE